MIIQILLACVGIAVLAKVYFKFAVGHTDENVNMSGKTCIVTGANTGLGFYTAKILAKNGANVIIAVRSLQRGQDAIDKIRKDFPDAKLSLEQLDLSDFDNVVAFTERMKEKKIALNVLVNNAGVALQQYEASGEEEEVERMFKTNHLGHFLLTDKLIPLMLESNTEENPGRVVIVSSEAHRNVFTITVDNLMRFTKYPLVRGSSMLVGNALAQYGFTKLCNLYQMYHLNDLMKQNKWRNITVNAIHPGAVSTELNREVDQLSFHQRVILKPLIFTVSQLFFRSVADGAQTQLHAAMSPEMNGVTGVYLSDCKVCKPSKYALDGELRRRLIDITHDYLKNYL